MADSTVISPVFYCLTYCCKQQKVSETSSKLQEGECRNPLTLRQITRVYDLLQLVTEVIQCRIAGKSPSCTSRGRLTRRQNVGKCFFVNGSEVLVAQLDRASASEAEGYWFESSRG